MTTTTPTDPGPTRPAARTAAQRTPISRRKLAIAVGVFFLVTHVGAIVGRLGSAPALEDPQFVLGSGSETIVLVAALFEVITALAIVGTAVTLFPVVRRYNEGAAIGYVGLRVLEAGVIAVGVVSILAIVTLRQDAASGSAADAASLPAVASALASVNECAFLVGPGFICGTNTVVLAYVLFKSRLVPRFIPTLGLIGGPLVFAANVGILFGFEQQLAAWAGLIVLPIWAWEFTLAMTLILRGFRPEPVEERAGSSRHDGLVALTTR
jgi:Domain of unknown function (DUF4386)